MTSHPLLEVDGLRVAIRRQDTAPTVLDGVSFAVGASQCLGIVGESGCGKSLTLRAVMGLLPPGIERTGGRIRLSLQPGAAPSDVQADQVAGRGLAMVFQDSHASLDPTMRVGTFIAETVRRRGGTSRSDARRRAVELLASVGVPDPKLRFNAYPHELSGGMRQRVAIALALATDPRVLLCDEPTTALDVTLQAQILRLLDTARAERGLGMVFVSHDIAVIRQIADVVAVMYAGQIIEIGPVSDVLDRPRHPYARALIDAVPSLDGPVGPFRSVPGSPPAPIDYGSACRFLDRCGHRDTACEGVVNGIDGRGAGHRSACVHSGTLASGLEAT
ncbi:ABC transporter ATP-binding protein [Rhizohabitans arisaemae]|uniref:ABC transporter ATP-binding protein n=1 Tax=Rhizohabitans arisaemae TaxID=2720610 RepID=UPI0024B04A9D|nr:ABC transporter ATP-binding protein [Rhizohabitans arisaemae]